MLVVYLRAVSLDPYCLLIICYSKYIMSPYCNNYTDDICLICCGTNHLMWINGYHDVVECTYISLNLLHYYIFMWMHIHGVCGYPEVFRYTTYRFSAKVGEIMLPAYICKKLAYYLYLIGYHRIILPKSFIKMLVVVSGGVSCHVSLELYICFLFGVLY